jgi:cell division transport system permease protein
MFISKEEINVMKLVGAGQFYISGPFIVTGAIYGLFSSIITLILFWPLAYWLGPTTERFFGSMSIFEYYISDFGRIFLIIVGSGILIGAISSSLALNRYLKHKKRK